MTRRSEPSEKKAEEAEGVKGAVRLRKMRVEDRSAIVALERRLFPDDAWTPEMFEGEFAQPPERRLYLVAEEAVNGADPVLIGYAGMLFTAGPQADVVTLAVEKARWGTGTGTALLNSLIEEAGRRGCAEGCSRFARTTRARGGSINAMGLPRSEFAAATISRPGWTRW